MSVQLHTGQPGTSHIPPTTAAAEPDEDAADPDRRPAGRKMRRVISNIVQVCES